MANKTDGVITEKTARTKILRASREY